MAKGALPTQAPQQVGFPQQGPDAQQQPPFPFSPPAGQQQPPPPPPPSAPDMPPSGNPFAMMSPSMGSQPFGAAQFAATGGGVNAPAQDSPGRHIKNIVEQYRTMEDWYPTGARPDSEPLGRGNDWTIDPSLRGTPGRGAPGVFYNMRTDASPYAAGGGMMPPSVTAQRARTGGVRFAGGLINSPVPGRTDKLHLDVPAGSYVVPSSVVSNLGQDNTMAGGALLGKMFRLGAADRHRQRSPTARFQGQRLGPRAVGHADGGEVEDVQIIAAGGEYLIPPEALIERFGDLDDAHRIMDEFVKQNRSKHIETLRRLPGPKND